eukprot:3106653-Prymnesium_polylepis.3
MARRDRPSPELLEWARQRRSVGRAAAVQSAEGPDHLQRASGRRSRARKLAGPVPAPSPRSCRPTVPALQRSAARLGDSTARHEKRRSSRSVSSCLASQSGRTPQ